LEDFKPTGTPEGPLSKASDWVNVTLDGKRYQRETNTMPQWAGSCWYYLRYIDPHNDRAFADPEKLAHWLPVDLYVGGAEHAVLHLLYSRFWHKVLFDRGFVHCPEPFQRLVNQGMILGENGEKMSKSRGNVVNPDDVIREYGADSMRLYEMFMGPLEAMKPWNMNGVEGVYRFLGRVWRLIVDDGETMTLSPKITDAPPQGEVLRELHRTIRKVGEDTEALRFNTAISCMMEFTNLLTKQEERPRDALEKLVLLLSPYAPHIAEELWSLLGHSTTLAYEPWPAYDVELTKADTIEVPVQINGKLRAVVSVPAETDKEGLEAAAKVEPKIAEALAGKSIRKAVVVPRKMVNFVIG
jgi:leucyl-tRNA synthetase